MELNGVHETGTAKFLDIHGEKFDAGNALAVKDARGDDTVSGAGAGLVTIPA